MPAQNAQVLFPVNVEAPFDYEVPYGMELSVGDFVFAPIGKQFKLGVVRGLAPSQTDKTLKPIAEKKLTRGLPAVMLDFVDWVAKYSCASQGMVLRMVLSSYKALDPSPMVTFYTPTGRKDIRITPARQAILDKGGPFPARANQIAERAGVSAGVARGFADAGGLTAETMPVDQPFDIPDLNMTGLNLSESQEQAAIQLRELVRQAGFTAALLDGVTGSGKTEVYFEAVADIQRGGFNRTASRQNFGFRLFELFGAARTNYHMSPALGQQHRCRFADTVTAACDNRDLPCQSFGHPRLRR